MWGAVTKGPLAEEQLFAFVRTEDFEEKMEVMSPSRTKGVWKYAYTLPPLAKAIADAKLDRRKADNDKRAAERKRKAAEKREKVRQKEEKKQEEAKPKKANYTIAETSERLIKKTTVQGYERLAEIVEDNSTKKDKLANLRLLEKNLIQTKRQISDMMQKRRLDRDKTDDLIGSLASLAAAFGVVERGTATSIRAGARRNARFSAEGRLRELKSLKRKVEELLITIGEVKHQVSEAPESAFQEEVPKEFSELLDPEHSRLRDQLIRDYESLAFDTLCCLIAADRRISKSERVAVMEQMEKIGTESDEEELKKRIDWFVERVKATGVTKFKAGVLDRVTRMAQSGVPLNPILKSVVVVAEANEQVTDEERAFCVEIEAALSQ